MKNLVLNGHKINHDESALTHLQFHLDSPVEEGWQGVMNRFHSRMKLLETEQAKLAAAQEQVSALRSELQRYQYLHDLETKRAQKAEGEVWEANLEIVNLRCELQAAQAEVSELTRENSALVNGSMVNATVKRLQSELQAAQDEVERLKGSAPGISSSDEAFQELYNKKVHLQAALDEAKALLRYVAQSNEDWTMEQETDHHEICKCDAAAFLSANRGDVK